MAWYTAAGGTTCVAAYDAVGASSLADSYVNEVNPGTYDAAAGVAPTWAAGTGWTFNGTTQYLTTGVVPATAYSMIVRFSGGAATDYKGIAGSRGSAGEFWLQPRYYSAARTYYNNGGPGAISPPLTAGVMCVAGGQGYLNGATDGASWTPSGSALTYGIAIGTVNNYGNFTSYLWGCNIQALAIYSGTLSAADVAAITTAMNALPTPEGHPAALRHGATGRRLFGPRIGAGGW